jgi:hypothetical protein
MSASPLADDAKNDLNSLRDVQRIACDGGASIIRVASSFGPAAGSGVRSVARAIVRLCRLRHQGTVESAISHKKAANLCRAGRARGATSTFSSSLAGFL